MMLVDYRIYCSIYAVAIVANYVACGAGLATIGNDRAQLISGRIWNASLAALVLTGVAHFLDWLWS